MPPVQIVTERLWWVVFTDEAKPSFFNCFLARGFRHCWCFTQIRACLVMVVNPCLDHCQIVLDDRWPYEVVCQSAAADPLARVVAFDQFSVHPPLIDRVTRRGFPVTCASYLGYTLGIDAAVQTPYGLYRHLMAGGGRIVAGLGASDR